MMLIRWVTIWWPGEYPVNGGAFGMSDPLKILKRTKLQIFLGIFLLELIETLLFPNPINILILVGMVIVFIGCFADDFC